MDMVKRLETRITDIDAALRTGNAVVTRLTEIQEDLLVQSAVNLALAKAQVRYAHRLKQLADARADAEEGLAHYMDKKEVDKYLAGCRLVDAANWYTRTAMAGAYLYGTVLAAAVSREKSEHYLEKAREAWNDGMKLRHVHKYNETLGRVAAQAGNDDIASMRDVEQVLRNTHIDIANLEIGCIRTAMKERPEEVLMATTRNMYLRYID